MNDPFELPSLEEIQEMDMQRSLAIEALEISNHSVKCQRCSIVVPLLRTLTKPRSNRIDALQKRVKWIENHCMLLLFFLQCTMNGATITANIVAAINAIRKTVNQAKPLNKKQLL